MSESTKRIDARGLACPKPVLAVKRALEEGGYERIEVLVDNPAARENVSRFATYSGHRVISVAEEDRGTISILLGISRDAAAAGSAASARVDEAAARALASCADAEPAPSAQAQGAVTLFIGADHIGSGDDELGALLMRAFLSTLGETEPAPRRIILMNGGVRLAVRGAETVESLRRLESAGMEILACGTCLKYFKLEDQLAVGRISNMYEIAGALLQPGCLTIP
ncbi:MAG TPA: sulfurtransferase-like selenium metabolism protein YedF [Rectinemataceae bacterium]|nr:sulfurtransferase-like selenium metabolism protein YedF [Rectinemataceae bacterium]